MKKVVQLGLGIILATAGFTALSTVEVSAHGYISQPISRGYQGSLEKDKNWSAAFEKYGAVINEPQSLEAPKGYPTGGPADGRIASANGAVGDFKLDQQSASSGQNKLSQLVQMILHGNSRQIIPQVNGTITSLKLVGIKTNHFLVTNLNLLVKYTITEILPLRHRPIRSISQVIA